jgi:hypothetical protein
MALRLSKSVERLHYICVFILSTVRTTAGSFVLPVASVSQRAEALSLVKSIASRQIYDLVENILGPRIGYVFYISIKD